MKLSFQLGISGAPPGSSVSLSWTKVLPLNPVRWAGAVAGLLATGPCFARIACARVRAFRAGARIARPIARARARQTQGALLLSVPLGLFRTGAKQETKRSPDTASSCLILSWNSQGQVILEDLFQIIRTNYCHRQETLEHVMRCHEACCAPRFLPVSCTLRNRKWRPRKPPPHSSQLTTDSPVSRSLARARGNGFRVRWRERRYYSTAISAAATRRSSAISTL